MHILQPPGAETPTTILVVDDAAHIRDVVKRILGGGCGYTVLEAKDGETCMRVISRALRPDPFAVNRYVHDGDERARCGRPPACLTSGYQSPLYVGSVNRDDSESGRIRSSGRLHQQAIYP